MVLSASITFIDDVSPTTWSGWLLVALVQAERTPPVVRHCALHWNDWWLSYSSGRVRGRRRSASLCGAAWAAMPLLTDMLRGADRLIVSGVG